MLFNIIKEKIHNNNNNQKILALKKMELIQANNYKCIN